MYLTARARVCVWGGSLKCSGPVLSADLQHGHAASSPGDTPRSVPHGRRKFKNPSPDHGTGDAERPRAPETDPSLCAEPEKCPKNRKSVDTSGEMTRALDGNTGILRAVPEQQGHTGRTEIRISGVGRYHHSLLNSSLFLFLAQNPGEKKGDKASGGSAGSGPVRSGSHSLCSGFI